RHHAISVQALNSHWCSVRLIIMIADSQKAPEDTKTSSAPSPVYPTVNFQVLNVDHVFLRQDSPEPSGNASLKTQSFLITGLGAGLLQPAVNASYGPLAVDASISPDLLLSGRRILPVILGRQVRSSSPAVKILFHIGDAGRKNGGAKAKDGAHCVTAYAFWETREVRGACLVPPGGFCVAQLKPEPTWFSSASRSGSSSREAERNEGVKGLQGNVVEVYFQSRRDQTGQCTPQDSLQRVGVGRGRDSGGSGTPMRRIGSVSLLKTPPGNPTFLRLRLGGAVVIQTSSKPLKTADVATFYVFLAMMPVEQNVPGLALTRLTIACFLSPHRGLLEVLQLDFVPNEVSEQAESHTISWRLELPGNVKDVGVMRIHTTQRDYVGLAPLVMNTDILNTAVLTGKMVSVPVKTLAVEANGSVTDVTNYTSCRSAEEDVLKVSDRCDYVYVNGKEARGKSRVTLNFTYGFLSAQLEMSVWMPRLPLFIDVADPELSQIKGWRVPVTTGNRSEEEEEMRKGRGCMLQYQHSSLRVLTPFVAQPDAEVPPDPLTGEEPVEFFLGPDWKVKPHIELFIHSCQTFTHRELIFHCNIKSYTSMEAARQWPEVQGYTNSVSFFVSWQEAVVSCWVQFSDGAVTPLDLFDRSVYSLTVSTPDEKVATVRRTPQSTFVVAQGEGEGKGALVRVELRICEECQKSKRKSKLAVGTALLKINFQSRGRVVAREGGADGKDSGASELVGVFSRGEVIESDLIKTFRAMSDLEIGMYTLVGVSCVALLAFFINCASYNLCFRKQKTPIQAGPIPSADPKDHKHDWVWLGGGMSTLKRESHRPLESRHSIDSMGARGLESALPTVSAPAVPERTATLGRSRTSSQQQHFQSKAIDPMANRSATLLARPHRSDPLHSPTSKRNQVQFTTFTTLDIKHLAALKKNGVDLNWANQQKQQHEAPAEPQTPLP
uniref:Transmembrane protein 132D-like n=1 Tax=Stegastes partitus TaxID=144197 RepID=A0A3B5AZX2_9TELE